MAIERWRPGSSLAPRGLFGELSRVERDMQNMIDQFFRASPMWSGWGARQRGAEPDLDMVDRKDEVVLRADMPGIEEKDVQVEVADGVLTLRGERREPEARDEEYYCCERWTGSFERSIRLPSDVDTEKIRATLENGVLEVHVPKVREARGKKVEVRAT